MIYIYQCFLVRTARITSNPLLISKSIDHRSFNEKNNKVMERKKLFFFFFLNFILTDHDFILTDHDMNLDHQQNPNLFFYFVSGISGEQRGYIISCV